MINIYKNLLNIIKYKMGQTKLGFCKKYNISRSKLEDFLNHKMNKKEEEYFLDYIINVCNINSKDINCETIEQDEDDIIGLHFEFNVGVEYGTQCIMSYKEIMELVEDKFTKLLEDEDLVSLGGKCEIIRKDNQYGIKVREVL